MRICTLESITEYDGLLLVEEKVIDKVEHGPPLEWRNGYVQMVVDNNNIEIGYLENISNISEIKEWVDEFRSRKIIEGSYREDAS